MVHVTHFNQLFWDTGRAASTVIEHGIVDPGYRYRGTAPHAAVVINDPGPRGRVTGTDLLATFRAAVPCDLFGMRAERLGGCDLPQDQLHDAMAARRVYLHPNRWTSLGLSLIEAMHLGMPVVAVDATAIREAVPDDAGIVSTQISIPDSRAAPPDQRPRRGDRDGPAGPACSVGTLRAETVPRRLGSTPGTSSGMTKGERR